MAWEKPSPQLIAAFDTWLPADERVERRKMFGCPCAFVNGNMFAGVYQQSVILRLAEVRRAQLLAARRAEPFSVTGRTMREYVMVANALAFEEAVILALIAEAFAYAALLPPKVRATKPQKPPRKATG
jgi:TfoX/Sxy family transcriptional regulator of competence genes